MIESFKTLQKLEQFFEPSNAYKRNTEVNTMLLGLGRGLLGAQGNIQSCMVGRDHGLVTTKNLFGIMPIVMISFLHALDDTFSFLLYVLHRCFHFHFHQSMCLPCLLHMFAWTYT